MNARELEKLAGDSFKEGFRSGKLEASKRIAELEVEIDDKNEYIVRTGVNVLVKLDKPLKALEEFRKRIDQLEEINQAGRNKIAELEQERRWISVKERLPEGNERIFVYAPPVTYPQIATYDHLNKCFTRRNVTHWQPLPHPPEGGGES